MNFTISQFIVLVCTFNSIAQSNFGAIIEGPILIEDTP